MWISFRSLTNSFKYAWKGLRYTYQHEQNFRIQLFASVLVVVVMLWLRIRQWEMVALLFVIFSVLILEILNTVLERFLDVMKPRLHYSSEIIKDMMAAVVLLASAAAVVVGVIVFYPYMTTLLR